MFCFKIIINSHACVQSFFELLAQCSSVVISYQCRVGDHSDMLHWWNPPIYSHFPGMCVWVCVFSSRHLCHLCRFMQSPSLLSTLDSSPQRLLKLSLYDYKSVLHFYNRVTSGMLWKQTKAMCNFGETGISTPSDSPEIRLSHHLCFLVAEDCCVTEVTGFVITHILKDFEVVVSVWTLCIDLCVIMVFSSLT